MRRQFGSIFTQVKPRKAQIAKKRWAIWPIVKKVVTRTCMVIGAMVLISMTFSIITLSTLSSKTSATLPSDMVLVLNIEEGMYETAIPSSFSDPFSFQSLTVHQVIEALSHAAKDKRVHGLLVSLDDASIDLTHIQELREAIKAFRASGKFAYLYTASFSDLGSAIGAYYFASVFEQIWMQPVGFLSITGISMEMPFGRAALEKIGARADFLQREEYKSALENLTHDQMTPANQEMMESILGDLSGQMIRDIAQDRAMKPAQFQALVDKGLFTGTQALQAKLIDRLDYSDVLVDEVQKKLKEKHKHEEEVPLVTLEDYYPAIDRTLTAESGPKVALVTIAGEIVPGSEEEPGYATADYIADAIHDAGENKEIKTIVLRIDSPGGSPTASETIRRAVVKAKENGKKIVVSMGPVAASGGYWLAVDADHIFAMPSTLTGSIGVIMGKFEVSQLWPKLGISWDGMQWGRNAGMWSINRPFTPEERAQMNGAIEDTYQQFLTRVAEGRGMKVENVRAIAKGRAWTGTQAKANGLIDDVGSLTATLDYVAKELGQKSRHELNIIHMPKPLSPVEQLMNLLSQQASMGDLVKSIEPVVTALHPAMREIQTIDRSGPILTYDPALRAVQ